MRIIVVNHVDREDRRLLLPSTWEVWPATKPIGQTYADITWAALVEGWGVETVVVQDDVRGEFPPATEFTVYGTEREDGHLCPRAFAADNDTWALLWTVWWFGPHSLCPGFTHLVKERKAPILNSVYVHEAVS